MDGLNAAYPSMRWAYIHIKKKIQTINIDIYFDSWGKQRYGERYIISEEKLAPVINNRLKILSSFFLVVVFLVLTVH